MIPIQLSIEGLYSYQQKQHIDFKKLTNNHLFGIFGSVGSGKSSILEAITFALYGKTDRLLASGDNRNYNMMNLKSDQLFIDFDFITGKNEQAYKVVVRAKRNSKQFNDVKKLERIAYIKKQDEYLPITVEELEQAIGLSYDNFKRTVIIPQGKFQEFLQLKSTERTRMMKELFNLEKYELYVKTKNLETKNNAHIQHLQGQLEQLSEISEDHLQDTKNRLTETEEQINKLNIQQKNQNDLLKELDKLKDLSTQYIESLMQKTMLDEQQPKIEKLAKSLSEFEYCSIHFKGIIQAITNLEQKIKQLNTSISDDIKQLHIHQQEYEQQDLQFKTLSLEYDRLDDYKKEVENIYKLMEIIEAQKQIKNNSSRLEKGKKAVEEKIEKVELLNLQEKNIREDIKNLQNLVPNVEELTQAQQWHLENKAFIKHISDLNTDIASAEKQIRLLNQQTIELILTKHHLNLKLEDKEHWQNEIEDIKHSKENELKSINTQIEKIAIKAELEQYAVNLKPGDACPLCGSEHHPAPLNSNKLTEQSTALQELQKKKEDEINGLNNSLLTIHNYLVHLSPLISQQKSCKEKITQLQTAYEEHQQKSIEKYKDAAFLEKTILDIKKSKELITAKENSYAQLKEELNQALKDKDRYIQELSNIQNDIAKHEHTIKLLELQIAHSTTIKYQNASSDQLNTEKENLSKKIKTTQDLFSATQKKMESIKKQIDIYKGSIMANEKFLLQEKNELAKQTDTLQENIIRSDFESLESIKKILAIAFDIDQTKEEINQFRQQYLLLDKKIIELREALENKKYDSEQHQKLHTEINETKEQLTTAARAQGELLSRIKDLTRKLSLKKELSTQLLQLTLRGEDIKTLKKLFHASGFVNYISSVYLQNLCAAANERFFKMTRQKMSLELSEDNNFEVRDYLNGGKLRNVKTLSGGQTFQAALALALALSDNVQSLTQTSQNFFFLDEGFGSLDKESLDVVFSTLKNLRKENRIVGLISHVEEMQQEIPIYLNITQHDEYGSMIEESWT